MRIKVLGCHGADMALPGASGAAHCCGFLVNDTVLIDAGTIASALCLKEQLKIRDICLTHLHFDHIKALPIFADNVSLDMEAPVRLTSIQSVLDGLRQHIFNDAVYPNFFALPRPDEAVFVGQTLKLREPFEACGLEITAVPVNHSVPAVGFLIRQGDASFLYSGDTCSTDELWKVAAREPTLKAAFIETSFPDELFDLALTSKHLTPALLKEEVSKLGRPDVPIYVYHMKPSHAGAIESQLRALGHGITILREGQEVLV